KRSTVDLNHDLPIQANLRQEYFDMLSSFEEYPQLHEYAETTTDSRGYCSALDAHCRNRTPSEDQQRIQQNVYSVRHQQHPHGNGGIARAPENRVHHKQQHDHRVAAKHPLRVLITMLKSPGIGTHQGKQFLRKENSGYCKG